MAVKFIKPVKSEKDYNRALKRIERLMNAELGTDEGDELDVLATLVQAYEELHYPIEAPDPIAAIKAHMDLAGLSQADLGKLFSSRSRASEVLNRRRGLTLSQAWALHKEWGIPAECLIKPYDVEQAAS